MPEKAFVQAIKKPAVCLRRPPGTKPNCEERQLKAGRIPADLKEDWAPSCDAEDAGRYRNVFCNCCMPSFEQSMYQQGVSGWVGREIAYPARICPRIVPHLYRNIDCSISEIALKREPHEALLELR